MGLFPFIFTLAWVGSIIHLLILKKPRPLSYIVEIFLLYQLVFSVGFNSLFVFYSHAFTPNQMAEYMGWPPENPFQQQVAYANLTFAILGFLCIWFRGLFWVATTLGLSCWYWANAYGHIQDWMLRQNEAPGNIGLPLYIDIFLPIILILLLIGYVCCSHDPINHKEE
ncbi:conserved putative membrane protein [Candidatus Protochlamydia naegleriophila]|uniref:Conserved putative membrane protein n=1 Tax=Candidatus Protochlamydia naegleriophila TaxID=389348 RepID=A0A0U5EQE3_9BACT|nr:DUF6790 family protein [Candidatus Protochlamydia naegleriophila]CUI16368.1 conserved putative membrane protein [Candidatus Protochlamydia naegleriophila]